MIISNFPTYGGRQFSIFKKGSALIITLLVIGVLSTVALGFGQIFVSDASVSRSFENTQAAFYATQAGLEDGMRQFIANRNIEGTLPSPSINVGSVVITASYRQPSPNFGGLAKDQLIEIDTASIASSVSSISITASRDSFDGNTGLQIEKINSNSAVPDQVFRFGQLSQTEIIVLQTTNIKVRIKAIGRDLNQLIVSAGSVPVDSGKTTISAVGTVGGVKRKLEATIDRKSGTLLGIFDYALLSQNSIQ